MKALSLVIFTMLLVTLSQNAKAASKVCYSCAADYVPGNPVDGNKTLGALALLSEDMLSEKDSVFMSDVSIYCEDFHLGDNAEKNIKEKIIPSMKQYSPNKSIDGFFIEAGCNPSKFANAKSPIAHIAAESPAYRLEHLKVIKSYYLELKRPDFFVKIINAQNTKGYTTLDYFQHMIDKKIFIKDVEKEMNDFITYLCDNGAVYSVYKDKRKCDGQYVVVK